MTPHNPPVEDLRLGLTEEVEGTVSPSDVDLVQRAVAGELSESELESLIDRLHLEPALAEAWRTAVILRDELADQSRPKRPAGRGRWYAVVGLAAALVLAVAIPTLMKWRGQPEPIMREAPRASIASMLEDDAALPRESFDLEWETSFEHGEFRVRVLGEDLTLLHEAASIESPGLRVPTEALTELESGSAVLWWVETTGPNGLRVRSPTFVQRIQ